MPRIAIAECKQEVSTFNPVPSRYEDFRVLPAEQLLPYHRSVREEVGGAVQLWETSPDIELVPAFGASSNTSGGMLAAESFQRLARDFLSGLENCGSVDGAYFSLHGAMQAESEDDPEGFLLEKSREILGADVPIVISLDLHGILTDRMLRYADGVVSYHTYPHVDFFETGGRAAAVLSRILREGIRPVTARVKVPALARGNELITESGAVRHCIERARQIETLENALSAGVMWGNPFTDVPELRTNAFVTLAGEPEAAQALAVELAQLFWQHHDKMQVALTSLEESVRRACQVTSGTVALIDAADATSSGASGDSLAIVAELMRQGFQRPVLAPVVDSAAAEMAARAGVGATVHVSLGGQLDPARFAKIDVEAQVRLISDGKFRSESFGWHWDSGLTVVLQVGVYTFVVGSRPVSLFDRSWFYSHGQNPSHFGAVIVKSPHCEPHMFADWCALHLDVDAPGATSADLRSLGHTKCRRPLFPLDERVELEPRADLFGPGA